MATNYPGALDDGTILESDRANNSLSVNDHATQHNNLSDAVKAVETELGTNPKGSYTDVKTRLADTLVKTPTATQIVAPTTDITGIVVKASVALATANLYEGRDSSNAIKYFVDKNNKVSAQGFQVNAVDLAASHLSNGVQGSGAVVLATSPSIASPALTGTPTVPTAAVDTNTTQAASTAFVLGQASAVGDGTPAANGAAARGTSTHFARADHVHPTDTTLLPKASPTVSSGPLTVTASGIVFSDATTQTTAARSQIAVVTSLPGSPQNGDTVKLRLGSSPYRYIVLTYDSTYGKWVSEESVSAWNFGQSISHNTTISTVSSGLTIVEGTDNYSTLRAAGLHLQTRFIHRTWNDSGSSGVFWISFQGGASGTSMRHDTQLYTSGFITWSSTPTLAGNIAATSWNDNLLGTTFDTDDILAWYGNTQSNASPNFTTTHTDMAHVITRWVA